jgi:hypothetical protein
VLYEIAEHPGNAVEEMQRILLNLRDPLNLGPVKPANPTEDQVRRRACDLMERIVRSIRHDLQDRERAQLNVPFDSWPEDSQEHARNLGQLADSACMQVYFASGAYEEKKQERVAEEPVLSEERRQRFLEEAGSLLDELAEFGHPSLVHHLLQTLEFLIPADPEAVFLKIGNVIRAGEKGGYQFESLAAELIVSLVERYIAQYQ